MSEGFYHICDNLYQGAAPKEYVNVTTVVNLMLPSEIERNPKPKDLIVNNYIIMSIQDGLSPGLDWLRKAVSIVDLFEDEKVLIHCRGGVSRSSMLTAAVLMKRKNLSVDGALNFIAEKNPTIDPAPAFIMLLKEFDKKKN